MNYNYDDQKETLKTIHKVLKDTNFLDKMHISIGTLLGAVRQKKLNTSASFNNWDDIDFSVNEQHYDEFKDTIVPELIKEGFHIEHAWMTSFGKIGEVTLYKGTNRLDVNILFKHSIENENYYLHCHWYGDIQLLKGLSADYYENLKIIELDGLDFYGPKNAEKYLEDCYGEDWRTPTKSKDEYKYWEDSPGIPWWNKTKFCKMLKGLD